MARTHLRITVELVAGGPNGPLWPRPGRIMIAARTATFEEFGEAIDDAFARWDRSHLHKFTLADGTELVQARFWEDEEPDGSRDSAVARLSRLRPGEEFAYVFDLGDRWQHLCTVGLRRADPMQELGIVPDRPLPAWGWGDIPDQYGRRWDDDDSSTPVPEGPRDLEDLPPIIFGWGPRDTAQRRR